jgi:hypothetical protein
MRTVETVRAVTPVVSQIPSFHGRWHILVVKSHHREQFYVGDTEILEIRNFIYQPRELTRMLHAGRWMPRKSANVQLIDYRAFQAR